MQLINKGYTGKSGIYVSLLPNKQSKEKIREVLESLNPVFPLDQFSDDAHMTVMYSKEETIDEDQLYYPSTIEALPIKFEYWDGHDGDGYLVLKMVSKPASDLHDHIFSLGAEHSFHDYSPHMTIIYNIADYKDKIIEWLSENNKNFNGFLIYFDTITISDCRR